MRSWLGRSELDRDAPDMYVVAKSGHAESRLDTSGGSWESSYSTILDFFFSFGFIDATKR